METEKLVYTDPYSGHEVVLVQTRKDPTFGVAYDPRSVSPPTPWSSVCPHCLAGRDREISIHLKREIRVVASMTKTSAGREYVVPTNGRPLRVLHQAKADGTQDLHIYEGDSETLLATLGTDGKISHSGDEKIARQAGRPQILGRCIKLLFSARDMDTNILLKLVTPLVTEQRMKASKQLSKWSPCRRIDWAGTIREIVGDRPR